MNNELQEVIEWAKQIGCNLCPLNQVIIKGLFINSKEQLKTILELVQQSL